MKTNQELQEIIETTICNISLPKNPGNIYRPIEYILSLGGKRIRPFLTLVSCQMFNGNLNKALDLALGLEIFHNFTLLHDDILDKAPIRRGKPTTHMVWNTDIALLSGDAMLILAYKFIQKASPEILPEVLELFSKTALEVCEGQQFDMDYETKQQVSTSEYLEMIRLKTSVLLGCCLKMGAIAAGASANDKDLIYRAGENLGLAFQLQDDWLDTFGNQDLFGKKIGGDILAGKKTYLYINTIQNLNTEDSAIFINTISNNSLSPDLKIETIKNFYIKTGSDSLLKNLIAQYHQKAISLIDQIKIPANNKFPLLETAGKLLVRNS